MNYPALNTESDCTVLNTERKQATKATREQKNQENQRRENQRIDMRIDLEVLNSVDHVITTRTSDSECVSVSVNSHFGIRH